MSLYETKQALYINYKFNIHSTYSNSCLIFMFSKVNIYHVL